MTFPELIAELENLFGEDASWCIDIDYWNHSPVSKKLRWGVWRASDSLRFYADTPEALLEQVKDAFRQRRGEPVPESELAKVVEVQG